MSSLSHQRCFNHVRREAAARCLECQRYYCRECVTEHDDRVICSGCLEKLAADLAPDRSQAGRFGRFCLFTLGFCLVWVTFYLIGLTLASLPDDFHEGELWKASYWQLENWEDE